MTEVVANVRPRADRPDQVRTQGGLPPRLSPPPSVAAQGSTQAPQTVIALPAVVNLQIYEGDDLYIDMQVNDSTGAAINLTGTAPMSQIRPAPNDPNILANITVLIDGTVTGLLHLHLNASDSNDLPASCAWDIQLSSPSITTIAAGTVTVTPQVTQ